MNTLLGISIPTYKRPEQLLATVRSVAAAGGLEHEIPVYIADDSLDDTNVATLATLAGEYPFLMVRRNERNLGIDGNILNSVNINECRYAWLLGEDDRLVPGAVTKMLAVLESSTAPFLYANYSSVNSDFSRVLKPASLALAGDAVQSADTFWRQSAWSAGFIG
ncbi:MAG TPA: glycosyltransferase, partial [Kiritimatiellia bacterium]|nr:glycosyltransferase [Kiritimatiellia bacterium]